MLSTALATLRTRWVSFAGAFLALALGSGVVAMMITVLVATSSTPFPGPQRYAAAPIVVIPDKTIRLTVGGAPQALSVQQPGGLSPAAVRRLEVTGRVVSDRTFPVQQAGSTATQVGHGWSAAAFTPYRLTAGHAPAADGQVVIGGGNPMLVGKPVQVTTASGTATYRVAGVTAPVWFEQAIFFSDAMAARISPAVDAVVAYGPLDAVRRAGGSGTKALTGDDRGAADPDTSGGKDLLNTAQAMAGTSTGLGVVVAVFVMIATFAFVVDQRRRELGLLRAVGATPRQVRRMIIIEAAVLGILASATGDILGLLGASSLRLWMVDHGVAPAWFTIHHSAPPLIIAFAVGLASALIGAAAASWRGSRVRPIEALQDASVNPRVMTVTRWVLGVGLLAIGANAARLTIAGNPGDALIVKNDLSTFVPIVAGFALLAPVLLKPVTRVATWPLGRMGVTSMLVRQNALTAGRRTAATAGPVVLALGLAGSMLCMEAIANATYISTVRQQTTADFVIRPVAGPGLSAQTVSAVRHVRSAEVTTFANVSVILATTSGRYIGTLNGQAVDPATLTATQQLTPVAGSLSRLGNDFLIIDQGTAKALSLRAGDHLDEYMPDGTRFPARIAAVIKTGVTEATAYVSAANGAGQPVTQIYVRASRNSDQASVASALQAAVRGSNAQVAPFASYLNAVRDQQQTQNREATEVILGVVLVYCLIAVANTLVMAASGRKREIAALSFAGATRPQTLRFMNAESALVVLVGAILAAGATVAVIAIQRAAIARLAASATLSVPWLLIGAIASACVLVALVATTTSAWPVLKARVTDLADVRE